MQHSFLNSIGQHPETFVCSLKSWLPHQRTRPDVQPTAFPWLHDPYPLRPEID